MALGSIVSLLSRKGGTGRSFLSVNLALALKRITKKKVLLIDLNLPYSGDDLMQLGLGAGIAMTQYAPKIDFLTPAALEGRLSEHPSGIIVLPACVRVELSRLVTANVVRKFLEVAQEAFDYIIVDHSPQIEEQGLAVLDKNTLSLIVLNQDILALNQARKGSDLMRAMHYPADRIHFVANRYDEQSRITKEIVESNIGKQLLAIVPEDTEEVTNALLSGQPVIRNRKLEISKALEELAQRTLYYLDRLTSEREHGISEDFLASHGEVEEEPGGLTTSDAMLIDLKLRVHKKLVREMSQQEFAVSAKALGGKELAEMQMKTEAVISHLLDEEEDEILESIETKRKISKEILDEALGLGPLEKMLSDTAISEIMVNGAEQIFIEKNGKIVLAPDRFTSEDQLRRIIERIVLQVGRRIDEQSPLVDARLLDGSRVNGVIPPVALDGSKLTIRKFSKKKLGVEDLLRFGTLNEQMAQFMHAAILSRKNIVIAGGTGSGKTTLLNIMSSYIPEEERIVTIEDSAELQLPQPHVVRLETRPPSIEGTGEITIRDLVKNSLRMRPDRIVIGECRGGEALDMLQAMNTGHDGSLTTAHANTPRDTLSRLETMCMMSGLELPAKAIRDQIAGAVDLIVQQSRLQDGSRKMTYITEVTGTEGDVITTQDIFRFEQKGVDREGKVVGFFSPTGAIPTFMDELAAMGIGVNREIFLQQRVG